MNQITQYDGAAEEEDAEELQNQFLTFQLSGETYGLAILGIKEILEYESITHIPRVPSYIHGVINIRGSVVPVINLANRLGRDSEDVGRRTCIVIAEVLHEEEPMDVGIVIDAVNEVLEIPATEIEPAPSFGARIRTDFIMGMGKVHDSFVILLNVEKVLSIDELSMLGEMATAPASEELTQVVEKNA